jgi:hypothetical protein
MNGLLNFADGQPFATGSLPYFVGEPGEQAAGRLLLRVAIEGQWTVAAVDTGGHYFVCHPGLTDALNPYLTDPLEEITLEIRGIRYRGILYLLSIQIPAATGESLPVPATVFIPQLSSDDAWGLPSFIGFIGVLDRMRFAVDPENHTFYFGPLGES